MAEIHSLEGQLLVATSENFSSKRQRRPSVRLGDLGDPIYDSNLRKSKILSNLSGKGSKSRPLMNIASSSSGNADFNETLGEENEGNLDRVAIGSWKAKKMDFTKRRLSNCAILKRDSSGEEDEDDFRGFDPEGSESPLKNHSLIHSRDKMVVNAGSGHANNDRGLLLHGQRRHVRTRISNSKDNYDGIELSAPSNTDARDWKCGDTSNDQNGISLQERGLDDGVRIWLNGLGLGRYVPVFEIHEVDDEILPNLTLEDLKEMGISAVGSRRKLFCAIQKLRPGFS